MPGTSNYFYTYYNTEKNDLVHVSEYGSEAITKCKNSEEYKNPEFFYNQPLQHLVYVFDEDQNGTVNYAEYKSDELSKELQKTAEEIEPASKFVEEINSLKAEGLIICPPFIHEYKKPGVTCPEGYLVMNRYTVNDEAYGEPFIECGGVIRSAYIEVDQE